MDTSSRLEADGVVIECWELPQGATLDDPACSSHQLCPREQKRAATITHLPTRRMYIYSRRLLRERLSALLAIQPDDIAYTSNSHGKPYLAATPAGAGLFFNISHSQDKLAMAYSYRGEVGIDIQYHAPRNNSRELAARFFAPEEIHSLNVCPDPKLLPHFYQIWAGKEAVIKAIGQGLQLPLNSFSVCNAAGEAYEKISVGGAGTPDTELSLCTIILPFGDFSAAVAWEDKVSNNFH